MKTVIIILVLIGFASATPLQKCRQDVRRYTTTEEDPLRVKYLLFVDERGKFHFEDLTRPQLKVQTSIEHVTLFLYTPRNENDPVALKANDLTGLISSNVYDPEKFNYFIIHGWQNDNESDLNRILKSAIMTMTDSNIFIVDWGVIANADYMTARLAVPDIGQIVGHYLKLLLDHYQLPTSSIRIIGHSLGAHIAGHVGDELQQKHGLVDSIVGLDPAGPLFTVGNKENRLDPDDADHVQILHTSGALLGWVSDLGHSDFYPNGGRGQPGCGLDPIGTCAHSRAYLLYEESILSGGFVSRECDNYKNYTDGACNDWHLSHFGGLAVDKSACGDYYFDTNKKSPFSNN